MLDFVKEQFQIICQTYRRRSFQNARIFYRQQILVEYGGRVFQQTIGIAMATNCTPLLADLFLHSYEADFIVYLIQKKEHRFARSFNLSFLYINDVLVLDIPSFGDFIHRFNPKKLR